MRAALLAALVAVPALAGCGAPAAESPEAPGWHALRQCPRVGPLLTDEDCRRTVVTPQQQRAPDDWICVSEFPQDDLTLWLYTDGSDLGIMYRFATPPPQWAYGALFMETERGLRQRAPIDAEVAGFVVIPGPFGERGHYGAKQWWTFEARDGSPGFLSNANLVVRMLPHQGSSWYTWAFSDDGQEHYLSRMGGIEFDGDVTWVPQDTVVNGPDHTVHLVARELAGNSSSEYWDAYGPNLDKRGGLLGPNGPFTPG